MFYIICTFILFLKFIFNYLCIIIDYECLNLLELEELFRFQFQYLMVVFCYPVCGPKINLYRFAASYPCRFVPQYFGSVYFVLDIPIYAWSVARTKDKVFEKVECLIWCTGPVGDYMISKTNSYLYDERKVKRKWF